MKTTINGVTYIVGFRHTTKIKGFTRSKDKSTGGIVLTPKVYDDKTICTIKSCPADLVKQVVSSSYTTVATAEVRRHSADTPNRIVANNTAFRKAITLVDKEIGAQLVPLIAELRSPAGGHFGPFGS